MANNFFLELFAGALETLGESKLVEVLQDLHDNDKTEDKSDYKSVIFGGYSFVTGIVKFTDRTKTKIDDAIVVSLREAIKASAAANGVEL
mgnify:CR=1 FL=1